MTIEQNGMTMSAVATLDRPETAHEATARVATKLAAFKNKDLIRLPVLVNLLKEMDVLRRASSTTACVCACQQASANRRWRP